jgi:hypothetical protein
LKTWIPKSRKKFQLERKLENLGRENQKPRTPKPVKIVQEFSFTIRHPQTMFEKFLPSQPTILKANDSICSSLLYGKPIYANWTLSQFVLSKSSMGWWSPRRRCQMGLIFLNNRAASLWPNMHCSTLKFLHRPCL